MSKQETVSQATREAAYQVTRKLRGSTSQSDATSQAKCYTAPLETLPRQQHQEANVIYTIMLCGCGTGMLGWFFLRCGHDATGFPELLIAPFALASGWSIAFFLSKWLFPWKKT